MITGKFPFRPGIRHLWVAAWGVVFISGALAAEPDFRSQILPILSEHCFACHGPDAGKREAGLRLDTQDGATASREGRQALVPEHPERSPLWLRVTHKDSDKRMPPPGEGRRDLEDSEIKLLESWILSGGAYQRHWAFEPIRNLKPPSIPDSEGLGAIDRFLLSRLKEKDLGFSPELGKGQWIRRATFDLTGLPPTWEEVQAFVNDDSPQAHAKVVDRLLESPRYGERWGRHWLDLARYADTHGASAIGFQKFPFSYTYRDYVIAAFNGDKPYERFLLEQVAADQLGLKAQDPARAALGFLTIGRQYRNRHDRLDDRIDVITRGLQGLTVTCARCHDHKFDPIPTRDYYSIYAALAPSHVNEQPPLVGDPEVPKSYQDAFAERKQAREDILFDQGEVFRSRLRMQTGLYLKELAKGTPEQDTSTFFLSFRTEDLRPEVLEAWRRYLGKLPPEDPVFGPWHQLGALPAEGFEEACASRVDAFMEENGDPKKFAAEHQFGTAAPRWNPRVLEELKTSRPTSFPEVAEAYGRVFAGALQRWMTSLLEAALEAAPGGTVIPDQDARHKVINSSIERQLRHHLFAQGTPTSLTMQSSSETRMFNRGVRDSVSGKLNAIEQLNLQAQAPPRAMELVESTEPMETFVFLRGNPVQRGEKVEPGFLSVVAGMEAKPFQNGERRLGLARALVDSRNPLTWRMAVNWVWRHHFGRGLVRTPDDFGTRGDPPTHPELLDYLASRFLEQGGSIKQLHREIMLSRAYRQASTEDASSRARDPDNALLWRMPRRHLEMEAMRDAMLAVTGELNLTMGGRPFEEAPGKAVPRRSVYAFVNRDVLSKLATTFDGADPSACTLKRPTTVVPQQTLFALNSDFIQDRALALLRSKPVSQVKDASDKVRALHRVLFSREPTEGDMEAALDFLQSEGPMEEAKWQQYAHALLASNEFHFLD